MDLPLKGSRDHRELHESDDKKYSMRNYLRNGNVHGLKYLGRKNKCEICFWLITLLAFTVFAGYFIVLTLNTHSGHLITTKSPPMAINTLPFPAITICPETKAQKNVLSFTDAYHEYQGNKTGDLLSDRQKSHLEALSQVCDPHLLENVKINEIPTPGEELHEILRNVTIARDVLLFCKFQHEIVDCKKLFKEVLTDEGICYTFNGVNHLKSSKRKGKSSDQLKKILPGANSGLNVVLYTKSSDIDVMCKGPVQGYKVKVHAPNDYPRMSSGYSRIPLNSETLVSVKPQVEITAPAAFCQTSQTKSLKHFREYSQQNCLSECFSQFVFEKCDCVKLTMVHGGSQRICNQHETQCTSEAEKEFGNFTLENGSPCDCPSDCYSLKFESKMSQADFDFKRVFTSYKEPLEDEFPDAIMSRLSVFVEDNSFSEERVTVQNKLLDTIAKVGGIGAFFLGASFISFIEVFFYLIRRFLC